MARASKPWFAHKRFGYGAALPISWEGWAVLLVFFAGLIGAVVLLDGAARVLGVGGLVIALFVIAAAKTEGGWRWRSGGDR
jgi:hypothetical protein